MNFANPTALIIGTEHFAAKKLIEELLKRSINVIGIGEYRADIEINKNLEFRGGIEDVVEKSDYVFDFEGNRDVWEKVRSDKARLCVIGVNDKNKAKRELDNLRGEEINWRVVDARGVYGAEMPLKGFLARAIILAVENNNLILPLVDQDFRVMSLDDLVEVVFRSCFLSGTEREYFLVMGKKTNSEEVAKILIDQAKMTRYKVIEKETEVEGETERTVEENWKKLRWEPRVEFEDGIKETLQYFFAKADELSRRGKKLEMEVEETEKTEEFDKVERSEEKRKRYEVMVDEEDQESVNSDQVTVISEQEIDNSDQLTVNSEQIEEEIKDNSEQVIEEEEDEEDEGEEFVLLNSNNRPVAGEESEEEVDIDEVIEEMEEEIEEADIEEEVVENKEVAEIKTEQIVREKLRVSKWWVAGVLVVMMAGVLAVPLMWIGDGWRAWRAINQVKLLIQEKKFSEAYKLAERAEERVRLTDQKINDFGVNGWGVLRNYQSLLRVAGGVLELEKKGVGLAERAEKISGAVFGETEIEWESELEGLKKSLMEVGVEAGVLQARLQGDWSWLPPKYRSMPQKGVKTLDEFNRIIGLSEEVMEIMPEFLGTDGKRREYMVLLQNEMELRPGGGFIGSYGILGFESGKLLNFEIKDVYEADGQLKGHVDPPEPIRVHLGEGGYFMRDANWQASFPVGAEEIKWFLEKETGRSVDGVIGINLAVAKEVLGVIGEVYVVDFKEKVNKDNLYEQAEFYSETKFFPGSIQKASFLGGLGDQLFEEIKSLPVEKRMKLFERTIELLERNEIQLALTEQKAVLKLAELGWDGAMYEGKCVKERCFADYFYLVEANLGVNKANYFIYRNMEQLVDISNQAVSRVVKINYENTAKNTNWPGGDYKNYVRIYLPEDVNLAEVSLVDGNNPNSKKVYNSSELSIKNVGKKKEIGFLITVPVMTKRSVEIRYSTQVNMGLSDKFSYLGYIQRQSGFGDTGLVGLMSFPDGWQPLQVSPAASLVNGKLLFNMKFDRDIKMGVELGK